MAGSRKSTCSKPRQTRKVGGKTFKAATKGYQKTKTAALRTQKAAQNKGNRATITKTKCGYRVWVGPKRKTKVLKTGQRLSRRTKRA